MVGWIQIIRQIIKKLKENRVLKVVQQTGKSHKRKEKRQPKQCLWLPSILFYVCRS